MPTTNIHDLSTESLRSLLEETEQTFMSLKEELKKRDEEAQAHEIEHLETHLKHAEFHLVTVRDFIKSLLES